MKNPSRPLPKFFSVSRVALLVVLALLLLFCVWFFSNHHQNAYTVYQPNSEAKKNRFSAALLLLNEQSKQATWLTGKEADSQLQTLLGQDAQGVTLIMPIGGDFEQVSALLDWVRAGGHLITFPSEQWYINDNGNLADQDDPNNKDWVHYRKHQNRLLQELGIDYYKLPFIKKSDEDFKQPFIDYDLTPLKLPSGDVIVIDSWGYFDVQALDSLDDVAMVADYRLLYPNMPKDLANQHLAGLNNAQKEQLLAVVDAYPMVFSPQAAMVDRRLGKGRITVVDKNTFTNPAITGDGAVLSSQTKPTPNPFMLKTPSERWWGFLTYDVNDNYDIYRGGIAKMDNAYLLNYLTDGQEQIYFLDNLKHPSLWSLLWQNATFMMWAMVLLVVAILLALPRQFGRFVPLYDDSEHNFLAYFEQVAAYLWRADKMKKQVFINRQTLIDQLNARLPRLTDATSDEKRCQLIATAYDIPPQTVHLALYATWQNETQFIEISQSFMRLAQTLAGKDS